MSSIPLDSPHATDARGDGRLSARVAIGVIAAALSGLLFGFDTAVIAGVTGELVRVFQLTPSGLGFAVSIALWGTLIGAFVAGPLGDRFGSRSMLAVTALLYLGSALASALAGSEATFAVARFVGGLAIGASSVLAPVYISELAPARLRGRLVGTFQLCIVLGILAAYASNAMLAQSGGDVAWRWKLGVAVAPAALLLAMTLVMPTSPRWLIGRGRDGEGRALAHRLGVELGTPGAAAVPQARERLSFARHRRPILLAVALAGFNQLSGINAILYYLNDVFAAAGFSSLSADRQAVAIGLCNLVATVLGMALIDRAGRKALLVAGGIGCAVALLLTGMVQAGLLPPSLLLPGLVLFILSFGLSQGAVIWVYLSEIFPQSVRAQGAALGAGTHWLLNALIAWAYPPVAAYSAAIPFFAFAAFMLLQSLLVARLFPETNGRTIDAGA
ncbi:sugar porter family MFS transporter [Sphingomonas sp. CJ99]